MKFKTSKQAKAWASVVNSLSFQVECACIKAERRLWKSGDARCRDLSRFIYKLSKKFSSAMASEIRRVNNEWDVE